MKKILFILIIFIPTLLFSQQEANKKKEIPKKEIEKVKLFGSSKSNKYHSPTCRYVDKIKPSNLISFVNKNGASKKGYVPCKVCQGTSTKSSVKKKAKKKSPVTSSRCQATTKKGKQCKRNSKAGSSYCWQHK